MHGVKRRRLQQLIAAVIGGARSEYQGTNKTPESGTSVDELLMSETATVTWYLCRI